MPKASPATLAGIASVHLASFIGLRFLRSPRQTRSISVVTWISGVGVMLGVTALIITISVMNGFRENLFLAVTGTMAHVRIAPDSGVLPPARAKSLGRALAAVPEVEAVAPYFSRQAFLRVGSSVRAMVLRGVMPEAELRVSELGLFVRAPTSATMERNGERNQHPDGMEGRDAGQASLVELLAVPAPKGERLGIVLGRPLAEAMNLEIGDEAEVISTVQRITPIGPVPLIKRFRVAGLLETGMGAIDEVVGYVHLSIAQKLYRTGGGIGGFSLRMADPADIDTAPLRDLAAGQRIVTWSEENRNIFQVMRLEKLGMFIVLTLIILVAFFNIISSLIMLVLEKRKAIAVLMSMGASHALVRRIFFMQGVWIGAVGTLAGTGLGLLACWALATFDLVPLPPGVFPLASQLPVRVEIADLAIITGSSFFICLLVTLYPATAAAKTDPISNLRHE